METALAPTAVCFPEREVGSEREGPQLIICLSGEVNWTLGGARRWVNRHNSSTINHFQVDRRASEGRELVSIKQCDDHYWFAAKQKNTIINRSGWLHQTARAAQRGHSPVASPGIKSPSSCLTPLLEHDGPACHAPNATVRRAESLFPTGKLRHHLFQPPATLDFLWRRGIFNATEVQKPSIVASSDTLAGRWQETVIWNDRALGKKSCVSCLC